MSKTMVVELPSGKKLLFGGPEKGGLHEVSLKDRLATKASGQFEKGCSKRQWAGSCIVRQKSRWNSVQR
jgi:hypothetical protein